MTRTHGILAAVSLPAAVSISAAAANGPVLLLGDAAETHAEPATYADLLGQVVGNVSNGQAGILALGVDVGSDAADFLLSVSAALPEPQAVAFINDGTIAVFGFSGYGMLYVPSDAGNVAGGITQAENDLLALRADDIAAFVNGGGGLFGLTQGQLENAYGYMSALAPVSSASTPGNGLCNAEEEVFYDNVSTTPNGLLVGINDENFDGSGWRGIFDELPESLSVLATANEPGCPDLNGQAAIVGALTELGFGGPVITPAAGEPTVEALGDLDNDGTPDVGATIPNEDPLTPGLIQIFFNQGNAEGSTWQGLLAGTPIMVGPDPSGLAVGQLNGDTSLDVVVTNRFGNSVSILFNNGDGTFEPPVTIMNVGNLPSAVTTADFNFDFATDFAVTLEADQTVVVYLNDPLDPGNFSRVGVAVSGGGFGFGPLALLDDDFDNNKCPDLTGAGSEPGIGLGELAGHVFVQLGQGDGTFSTPTIFDVGLNATDVATGDVNLDGCRDILAANTGESSISVLLGDCAGGFVPAPNVPVGQMPGSVDLVDFDGDFAPDMLVAAIDPDLGPAVQVLLNTAGAEGSSFFGEAVAFSTGGDPNFALGGDMNVDGLFDIVAANVNSNAIAVLLNQPQPLFNGIFASLDIKPGGCPNPLNPNSHGVTPMALVGTGTVSVTDIDFSSLELVRADGTGGSVAPIGDDDGDDDGGGNTAFGLIMSPGFGQVSIDGGPQFEDVATPFTGELCDCHDLGPDGILDMKIKFKTDDLVDALELDDVPNGSLVELTIIGSMTDGTAIEASDCVLIVPPSTGPGLLLVGSTIPDLFIDVSPSDDLMDDDGWPNFARSYAEGTPVTLTAPSTHDGAVFLGWSIETGGAGGPTIVPTTSITVTVTGESISAQAQYIQLFPKD